MYSQLKNIEAIPVFHDMSKLYRFLGLPVENIAIGSQLAIHWFSDDQEILKTGTTSLPDRSTLFRSGFYSLIFVKNIIGPTMIHFIPPGHCRSFTWENTREAYLLTFSETFLKEHVHAGAFEAFPFLLGDIFPLQIENPAAVSTLNHLYEQIFGEYVSDSTYRNKIIGNLLMVLLLKIKEYVPDTPSFTEHDRKSHIVHAFKQALENHYRELLNGTGQKIFRAQDYAIAQNLNPNYLNCVIKNKTGKPVSAWITDKTISEAKSLLLNSSISIKEIAYLLGFAEANHFSNYFKKHTRLTPVSYRKQAGSH